MATPPITYAVQLVVYAPNSYRQRVLPDVTSFAATSPFNDVGSLTFTYPKDGRNVELISTGFFEIAVEIDTGSGFVEPDGYRFVNLTRTDEGTETSGEMSFDLPSYSWLLKRSRLNSMEDLQLGKRSFVDANAGQIMWTLLAQCQLRGVLPGLTAGWTWTNGGNNGAPWDKVVTVDYTVGQDLYTALSALAEEGLCDWTTRGRQLLLVPADTLAVERSATVVLRYGVDISEGPNQVDATNLVHSVIITGEDDAKLWLPQAAGTPRPWGIFEDYITAGGVSDGGSLALMGDASLAGGVAPAVQLTRTVRLEATPYAPHVDYAVGDWITAPGLTGLPEKLRVREIAISKDSEGVSAALILNDRLTEASVKAARRAAAITGGATNTTGSGANPAQGDDVRVPATPTGMHTAQDYFFDAAGNDQGIVTLDWAPVTKAVDGTDQPVASYTVWQRQNFTGSTWYSQATTTHPDVSVTLSPFKPGSTWQFCVSATGENKIESARSAVVSITIVIDTAPPPVPATPVITARLGVLLVTWNGLGAGNVPQPADYKETEIHFGTLSNFTPTAATMIDRFTGPGMMPIANLTYNATYWVKLVSTDRRNNRSAASAAVSGVVTPLVDTDIIGKVIDGAALIDYSVDGTQSVKAGTIDTTRLRVGQANMVTDPGMTDAALNAIRKAGSASPAGVTIGTDGRVFLSVTTVLVDFDWRVPLPVAPWGAMPVEYGKTYRVAITYTPSGTGQTGTVEIHQRTTAGADSFVTLAQINTLTSGQNVFSYAPASTVVAATVYVKLITGKAYFSAPDLRSKTPGVLIEDGAITAANIAALAITAGKIAANAVTADSIAAGSITASEMSATAIDAMTITGATIRTSSAATRMEINTGGLTNYIGGTARSMIGSGGFYFYSGSSGARTEFDLSGLRCYNSSGVKTIDLSATTGNGMITGTFITNTQGVYPQNELSNNFWTFGANTIFGLRMWSSPTLTEQPYIGAVSGQATTVVASGTVSGSRSFLLLGSTSWSLSRGTPGLAKPYMMAFADGHIDAYSVSGTPIMVNGTRFYENAGGTGVDIYGRIDYSAPTTTSGSAIVGVSNTLYIISSLSKYKLDQKPLGLHYEILDLPTKTWIDKGDRERNPERADRIPGIVAEDLLALSEANGNVFEPLIDCNNEERTMQGLFYDRIPAYLIPVMRDMNARIAQLESSKQ